MVIKVMKVLIIPPVVMDSGAGIARQISSDSVSSINSLSSACSMTSQQSAATDGEGRKGAKNSKKKGWVSVVFCCCGCHLTSSGYAVGCVCVLCVCV